MQPSQLSLARRRALLVCDDCGRVMPRPTVDDVAAAALRAGWRVKSAGAAGALWSCPDCRPASSGVTTMAHE